jgi:hypothetical protein
VGFFSRAVAKSELNTVAVVEEALDTYTDLDHGRLTLPCHIVQERHTGVWVGAKEDGNRWVGVYRCQSHFWGIELDSSNIEGAKMGQDQSSWLLIKRVQGDYPEDLGLMSNGAPSLAVALGQVDYIND